MYQWHMHVLKSHVMLSGHTCSHSHARMYMSEPLACQFCFALCTGVKSEWQPWHSPCILLCSLACVHLQMSVLCHTPCSSCKRVSELHAEHVRIDQPALEAYAAMLVPEEVKSVAEVSAGNKFPIKFDSQTAEVCCGSCGYLDWEIWGFASRLTASSADFAHLLPIVPVHL